MKNKFLYGFVAMLFATGAFGPVRGVCGQQKKAEATRSILDIPLSPGASTLLVQVEALYGTPVTAVENSSIPTGSHARSLVSRDGIPEIQISPMTGKTEAAIVHELMHLLGTAQGMAYPIFIPEQPDVDPEMQKFLYRVLDQVEHAYFFPKARSMGLDIDSEWKPEMHDAIEQRRIDVAPGELREADLALYYFECTVVLQDKQLAAELETNLFSNDDTQARSLGRSVADLTKRHKFGTPDDVMSTFVTVSNTLLESNKLNLSFGCVHGERRGKITQNYGVIFIEHVRERPDKSNVQPN